MTSTFSKPKMERIPFGIRAKRRSGRVVVCDFAETAAYVANRLQEAGVNALQLSESAGVAQVEEYSGVVLVGAGVAAPGRGGHSHRGRDGARFYVDRTSPFKAIQLVRTPGFKAGGPAAYGGPGSVVDLSPPVSRSRHSAACRRPRITA
jgi:hypothetical protein